MGLGPPSLDETGNKRLIYADVAQSVNTVKSGTDHVWANTWIHPPQAEEGSHLLTRSKNFL